VELIEGLVLAACQRVNNGTLTYGQFDNLFRADASAVAKRE
jgi:hypothetical protein